MPLITPGFSLSIVDITNHTTIFSIKVIKRPIHVSNILHGIANIITKKTALKIFNLKTLQSLFVNRNDKDTFAFILNPPTQFDVGARFYYGLKVRENMKYLVLCIKYYGGFGGDFIPLNTYYLFLNTLLQF